GARTRVPLTPQAPRAPAPGRLQVRAGYRRRVEWRWRKASGSGRSVLAFPVVERLAETAHEEALPACAVGAHLAAVGVFEDLGLDHRREHEHSDRSIGPVGDLVKASVSARERHHVAFLEFLLPLRCAQRRSTTYDQQPLLLGVV